MRANGFTELFLRFLWTSGLGGIFSYTHSILKLPL